MCRHPWESLQMRAGSQQIRRREGLRLPWWCLRQEAEGTCEPCQIWPPWGLHLGTAGRGLSGDGWQNHAEVTRCITEPSTDSTSFSPLSLLSFTSCLTLPSPFSCFLCTPPPPLPPRSLISSFSPSPAWPVAMCGFVHLDRDWGKGTRLWLYAPVLNMNVGRKKQWLTSVGFL